MEEELTVKETPVDLDDLFGGETVIELKFKGRTLHFHYRENDSKTDLEFQRRSSSTRGVGVHTEASEKSLTADLWLVHALVTKVEVVADGEQHIGVADWKTRIAPDVQRTSLFYYRQRIGGVGPGN